MTVFIVGVAPGTYFSFAVGEATLLRIIAFVTDDVSSLYNYYYYGSTALCLAFAAFSFS
jgi:hypothetical protein